ncbi:hypothetical protein B0T20DRAFT_466064 [Sordaria brevicollis]|uniref:Uncharacterized protein n=1 Tax=Sordaria brevicollis TaxID=83679 RepID=A0AAE0PNR4_SORBR|nr:hypothetical protein B0T20DRAFT_466064 [Sordaria brevicollis]
MVYNWFGVRYHLMSAKMSEDEHNRSYNMLTSVTKEGRKTENKKSEALERDSKFVCLMGTHYPWSYVIVEEEKADELVNGDDQDLSEGRNVVRAPFGLQNAECNIGRARPGSSPVRPTQGHGSGGEEGAPEIDDLRTGQGTDERYGVLQKLKLGRSQVWVSAGAAAGVVDCDGLVWIKMGLDEDTMTNEACQAKFPDGPKRWKV